MTTFKQQFQQLLLSQPRYNLKQVATENCDYADTAVKSGNCYYTFGAFYSENVFYGRYSRKCRDCFDITLCVNCEGCYACVDCVNCYMVQESKNCQNCTDCSFCQDCFSCTNCFGCVGLYQKEYCWFNEQLSQAEYHKRLAQHNLQDATQRRALHQQLEQLKRTVPLLNVHQFKCENSIGENLAECGNCYQCYDSFALENCLYCIETNGNKDCCDLTVCFEAEACYSSVQSPLNYNCNFLFQTDQSRDSEFCAYSKNLKNCFGCVYLANKEYYILNKPYSAEAYTKKITEIKQALMAHHEYNMLMYFASDYEQQRLATETDGVIKTNLPA